jgi:hypothetical protein
VISFSAASRVKAWPPLYHIPLKIWKSIKIRSISKSAISARNGEGYPQTVEINIGRVFSYLRGFVE